GRDREAEAGAHARAVGLDRRVDELAEVGELDDRRQQLLDPAVLQAEERPAEQDVLDAGEIDVEARAEAEQARDLAADVHDALVRAHDPRQDLEERALAGAVRPDDPQRLAVAQLERDMLERPEPLGRLAQHEVRDRGSDRRLAGEPEVVPDAQVLGLDGIWHRGRHRTFANSGSTRLKNVIAMARSARLATSRI